MCIRDSGYAEQSGIPYEIGFIKNKYIGRTFIAPGQKSREDKVRIKPVSYTHLAVNGAYNSAVAANCPNW